MNMRCIDCAHYSLKDAGEAMARVGLGVCKHQDGWQSYFTSALYERECSFSEMADKETAEKREKWLMEVFNQCERNQHV